jgi:hypothetical protein
MGEIKKSQSESLMELAWRVNSTMPYCSLLSYKISNNFKEIVNLNLCKIVWFLVLNGLKNATY